MFLTLALGLNLVTSIPINRNIYIKPDNIKIKYIENNKLSYSKKQLLYKWCKKYSKKNIHDNLIMDIIDKVYKYSDDPLLSLAMISVESNFNPNALSSKGALGLTQVMPLWIPVLSEKFNIETKKDLKKISNNIKAGNYIITYYIEKEGNLSKGLNKYVNGSKSYVKKVLIRYNNIKLHTNFYVKHYQNYKTKVHRLEIH